MCRVAHIQAVAVARTLRSGALLRLGPEPLSVSWSHPASGVAASGLGVAAEGLGTVEWLDGPPATLPPGPFFGGWAFDVERAWAGFDAERWFLPEVLGWWDGERTHLAAFGIAGTGRAPLEARLDRVSTVEPSAMPSCARRVGAAGDAERFRSLVDEALLAIAAGRAEKLVAARAIRVESDEPIAVRGLLKRLEARNPSARTFLLGGRDGSAFVGASPELLCEIRGGVAYAEALAGTAEAGAAAALLGSDKDLREHRFVVEAIREALAGFAQRVDHPDLPQARELPHLAHLFTPVRAVLRPGVDPLEVARALHPTPAVAGTPRREAMAWLRSREGFDRGWYTGVVGTFGPRGLTLAVGLRCARVLGRRADVYVGAGVVRGSSPAGEWLETERKARGLLQALGVADA